MEVLSSIFANLLCKVLCQSFSLLMLQIRMMCSDQLVRIGNTLLNMVILSWFSISPCKRCSLPLAPYYVSLDPHFVKPFLVVSGAIASRLNINASEHDSGVVGMDFLARKDEGLFLLQVVVLLLRLQRLEKKHNL